MHKKIKGLSTKLLMVLLCAMLTISNFQPLLVLAMTKNIVASLANNAEINVSSGKDYVYLSDLWNTNKLLLKQSSWNDARALKVNENEPGDILSLLVDGKKTYFLNGVFAHAKSTVIYDISEYTANGYDTFSAYLGVDTYASTNSNGVKITISVSNDNETWEDIKTTNVLKSNTNAEKVSLKIADYKYLKLYADDLGSNSSDHATYANAMIYNSAKYTPATSTEIDWIKTIAEYDTLLAEKSNDEIVTNASSRLTLLQRTFVSRVDYSILQAWANSSSENLEVLEWLFKDVSRLEQYILGGTPTGGSYIKSLTVLSDIYKNHKEDFDSSNKWNATLQKLMFATSLTHATTIESWFSGENGAKVYSTGLGRYEAIKELFIGSAENKNWKQKTNNGNVVPYTFEWKQFQDLTVEEMRWVTDNNLSDEEFLWLNWYATITKMGYTQYSYTNLNDRGEMNPYTYINYGSGGNVGRDDYYTAAPMCGYKNEFYDPNARNQSCYDKYQLNDWESLKTQTKSKPTLWIAFEEDGVCGTLMHVGANLEKVFGIPSAGLGQPGHGAYIYAKRVKDETTGKYYTQEWTTYNWVSDWDQSEKGERLLLDWGTRNKSTVFNSTYNLIYIPLAQKALNDYENYRLSELYMFMADVQTSATEKEKYYNLALEKIPYHITAWYNLLTLKVVNGASSLELNTLGQKMMNAVGNAPTAIDELSNIIEKSLGEQLDSYDIKRDNILKDLTKATDNKYMNASGVRAVAKSLLGQSEYKAPASFSFDDNILRLESSYASRFEYSLDYNNYSLTEKENIKWTQVEGKSVDLTDKLSEINAESDIAIHLIGDSVDNVFIIDITEAAAPTGLYANDLENKVIGATNKMEWKLENSDDKWVKFTEDTKFEGQKSILVRNGATGTTLASNYIKLTFAVDPVADPTKVYIPISRLSATASSRQNNSEHESKAIDGNINTMWHTYWDGSDKELWINIKIDGGAEISKIEYLPRQDGSPNGRITKAQIAVSEDGVKWTVIGDNVSWANDSSIKTFILENPTHSNYVRIKALETADGTNYASASMINLYENTVPHKISIDDLSVSYIMSGYVYNGEEKTPYVTVKHGDDELINGEHYTIQYQNNINAGTGKIIITGLGIYDGTKEYEFTISKAKQPNVMPEEEMTATIIQKTLESVGGLPEGWSWKNPETNLKAGAAIDALAEYKDKDNYEIYEFTIKVIQDLGYRPVISGSTKFRFDIQNGINFELEDILADITITDVEDGVIDIADSEKVEITYDWKGDLPKDEGTYHIYIVVTDSHGNVSEHTIEITLINTKTPKVEIDNSFTIVIDDENLSFTGSELTPNITITDKNDHVLTEGVDYELEFNNNLNAGTATVTIKGIDVYTGGVTREFTIKKATLPAVIPDSTLTLSPDTTSLGDINLPDGWHWANENVELIEGENKIKLIYSGDTNHEAYEVEIIIIKTAVEQEPDDEDDSKNPDTDKKEDNNNSSSSNNSGNKNNNSNVNNNTGSNANDSANTESSEEIESNNSGSNNTSNSDKNSDNSSETNKEKVIKKENKLLFISFFVIITVGIFMFLFWKSRKKEDK